LQITSLHRGICLVDLQGKSAVGCGAVFCSSSGAIGWLMPLSNENHQVLTALTKKLYTGMEHVAGLNPLTFRATTRELDPAYGAAPPVDGILDGELLQQFLSLPRTAQDRLALAAGHTMQSIVHILCSVTTSAAFF
jgi:hypothetical protein